MKPDDPTRVTQDADHRAVPAAHRAAEQEPEAGNADSSNTKRSQATLRETAQVVRIALRGLFQSRLPQMAAALAFRTLFAVIPILVISVAFVGAFADADDVKATLDRASDAFGISNITISDRDTAADLTNEDASPPDAPPPDASPSDASPPDELPAEMQGADKVDPIEIAAAADPADLSVDQSADQADGSQETRLEDLIAALVDRLLNIPFAAIGAVGLLTLIYAAISMLVEIERSFNHVYRAKGGRSWVRRVTQYWTTLTLGAILIFLTFYTSVRLSGVAAGTIGYAVSVAITALFLVLAYTTIPNARVHVRTAAVGGLVAAIAWELAKLGFRRYLEYSVGYAKLYGSIGVLPLFMLWIYLTWVIVLFGLQVSYGLQHIGKLRELSERDEPDLPLTEPAAAIPIANALADSFRRGKPAEVSGLAEEAGVHSAVADEIMRRFASAGLVHKVEGDDAYVLALPPAEIRLDRVLREAFALVRIAPQLDGPADSALERMRGAQIDAVHGLTLADLIDDAPSRAADAPYDPS
ncbi:MAG: YhjD/YihY/BrkB family envelope integrity protein [Planctomycetota bacterium]